MNGCQFLSSNITIILLVSGFHSDGETKRGLAALSFYGSSASTLEPA